MKLKLSVVDQVPVHAGSGATQHATRLAKTCDQLCYQRYWIAEHHSSPSHASHWPNNGASGRPDTTPNRTHQE